VVDLQRRLVHRHVLDPLQQFAGIPRAEVIERLVVHPQRQHVVAEDVFRNGGSPDRLPARLERSADGVQEEGAVIVGQIAQRHGGVEETQGVVLRGSKAAVENAEERRLPPGGQLPLLLKEPGVVGTGPGGRGERSSQSGDHEGQGRKRPGDGADLPESMTRRTVGIAPAT